MKNLIKITLLPIIIVFGASFSAYSVFAEEQIKPVINEVMSSNVTTIQDEDGDHPDWIEIFNPGTLPIDLEGYCLSDNEYQPFMWSFTDISLEPNHYLVVFASGKNRISPNLHTNFKIKAKETLILTDSSGTICDRLEIGKIPADFSFGRKPDGEVDWVFFTESTPGESNRTQGYRGFADSVLISFPGGFYNGSISLKLSTISSETSIHYTLDGSEPTESSPVNSSPIEIDKTTVVRARAFEPGLLPGRIITYTNFINENFSIPVISIATDSDNLWDNKTGIYVEGYNKNFEQDWERPISLEFYEPNGQLGFSMDFGMKIFGGWSRNQPQKSLEINAKTMYDSDCINYQLFDQKSIDRFRTFILRNSGNDWSYTLIRDAMIQSLVINQLDIDVQAYKPSILFLNGEYWGIHNIRERVNRYYPESNYGVDPDNIDLLEGNNVIIEGDADHYSAMLDFIENNDMSLTENYRYIKTQMDINEFMNYQITNIYIANTDWPSNNIKYWRSKIKNGKWRWIMFDTDYGFNLKKALNPSPPTHNTLEMATAADGPGWPNPPWSTFLLRKLFENTEFKNEFIQRFAHYLNTTFHSDRVIHVIDTIQNNIKSEIPMHIKKWKDSPSPFYGDPFSSVTEWENNIEVLRDFARIRSEYIHQHILNKFGLSGMVDVFLNTSNFMGGRITVNSHAIPSYPWNGTYFKDIPIRLTAMPNPGYQFAGWTGITPADSISTMIKLTDNLSVTAIFEPGASNTIVINEINYNSSDDFNPDDWVELYNPHGIPVDISGWVFKDEEDIHTFIFPENMIIGPKDYLVLCRDTLLFQEVFPEVDNFLGNFDFGLSGGGELIRLFNAQGVLVDSLTYDDASPWPEEPDGNGPTLSLINPNLDNALPDNWASSGMYGTPGAINDVFVGIDTEQSPVPVAYSLGQNYPNPFNSVTIIPFYIPRSCRVTIEIYSILGQRVAKILDDYILSGHHKVAFNAFDLASGIYFYAMKVDGFIKTKHMLLLK